MFLITKFIYHRLIAHVILLFSSLQFSFLAVSFCLYFVVCVGIKWKRRLRLLSVCRNLECSGDLAGDPLNIHGLLKTGLARFIYSIQSIQSVLASRQFLIASRWLSSSYTIFLNQYINGIQNITNWGAVKNLECKLNSNTEGALSVLYGNLSHGFILYSFDELQQCARNYSEEVKWSLENFLLSWKGCKHSDVKLSCNQDNIVTVSQSTLLENWDRGS